MQVSNNGNFSGVPWEPYATTKDWALEPGGGLQTVYARFTDSYGNISAVYQDSINVFNTPAGRNVTVADALSGATITFDEVLGAGMTSIVVGTGSPDPPAGFLLGDPPVYLEIATTASTSGPIQVCLNYQEGSFVDETAIRMFHHHTGAWSEVASLTIDTTVNRACGSVAGLSSFALLVRDTVPPVVTAPPDCTVIAREVGTAVNIGAAAATDNLAVLSLVSNAPALFPVGTTVVTWTATDTAGNTGTAAQKITVVYCFEGFLPPVSLDKPHSLGSTVPVKFGLSFADGASASGATARLTLKKLTDNQPVGDPIAAESTSGADTGNLFRYDPTGKHYIFNLSTRGLSKGNWEIAVSLDDGTRHTVRVALKN